MGPHFCWKTGKRDVVRGFPLGAEMVQGGRKVPPPSLALGVGMTFLRTMDGAGETAAFAVIAEEHKVPRLRNAIFQIALLRSG